MLLTINHASTTPIYSQLESELKRQINNGHIKVGDRLPAANELADSLDLNRNTVLKVYRQLRDDGLVELKRGRGATVIASPDSPPEVEQAMDLLTALAQRHRISLATIEQGLRQRGLR